MPDLVSLYFAAYLLRVGGTASEVDVSPRFEVSKVRHALMLRMTVCLDAGAVLGVGPPTPVSCTPASPPPLVGRPGLVGFPLGTAPSPIDPISTHEVANMDIAS